ncbi:rCG35882 [Rattus norvegicus]|uniref:RCG35882 n=1 Tax=Rattus norvegicus TaxID=10116 RepID=A6IJI8_RAT|nr:rCG35882 [Rattus norvegicus]
MPITELVAITNSRDVCRTLPNTRRVISCVYSRLGCT